MAAELYTNAAFYVRGALLVEATDITIDRKTGDQVVLTLAKGFGGISPGAKMCEISFDNAVPDAGAEYDPGDDMEASTPVPVTCFAAGKSYDTTGFVTEDTFKKGVDKPGTISMKMVCFFSKWR